MLVSLLSHDLATPATIPHVLNIYSHIHQPLATEVSQCSQLNGEHHLLRELIGPDVSSTHLLGIIKQIQENFKWVSETNAGEDLQQALGLLQVELTVYIPASTTQ